MQFEQMMTILAPELESGNSTDAGDKASISSTTDYFNMMFPVMMSMGYGGTFMAFAYHILYRIRLKIWSKLYNSIHIKYNDDTFKWVNRYIKDMGYVVDTNGLVCGLVLVLQKNGFRILQTGFQGSFGRLKFDHCA